MRSRYSSDSDSDDFEDVPEKEGIFFSIFH